MHASQRIPTRLAGLFLLGLLLWPAAAQAHVGAGSTDGLVPGVVHPLTGLDHLCAMLAVGLWAGQRGGRAMWVIPLTFLSVMSLGAVLGMKGVSVPLVEPGIVASLLVLGLLVAAAVRLPLAASAAIVGLFALVHGHAHGTEMPETVLGLTYGLGFAASTALLLLLGIGMAVACKSLRFDPLTRLAGAAVAACGLYLCFVG